MYASIRVCQELACYARGVEKSEASRIPRKRGAPPKAHRVDPDEILSTAVEIVTAEGVEALSIRRLANRVGITPMAVYNHFASKDELLGAVIDKLIGTIPPAYAEADDWVESLRIYARTIRSVALESPDWIRVLTQTLTTPIAFDRMESTLRALRDRGLSPSQATVAYTAVYGFAFGQATLESARVLRLGRGHANYWATDFTTLSAARYPTIFESASQLNCTSAADEFERALDRLLNSLRAEFSRDQESAS